MGDDDRKGGPARLLLRYVGQFPVESFMGDREADDMANLPPGACFEVAPPGLVVGRLPDADIKIFSPYVARRHVRLWPTDDGIALEDPGSTNGTFVNGTLVSRAILREGDRLTIAGQYEFRVVSSESLIASFARAR